VLLNPKPYTHYTNPQDAAARPSMPGVLGHPMWWGAEARLQFLVDISDRSVVLLRKKEWCLTHIAGKILNCRRKEAVFVWKSVKSSILTLFGANCRDLPPPRSSGARRH
jgi:hypothetical protein